MSKFLKDFLLGASTAAHQVEGNNIHSDYYTMELMIRQSEKAGVVDSSKWGKESKNGSLSKSCQK